MSKPSVVQESGSTKSDTPTTVAIAVARVESLRRKMGLLNMALLGFDEAYERRGYPDDAVTAIQELSGEIDHVLDSWLLAALGEPFWCGDTCPADRRQQLLAQAAPIAEPDPFMSPQVKDGGAR